MNKEKVLLFGGTAESTEISEKIINLGYDLTLSTVSNDLKLIHSSLNLTRKIGKMNKSEIINYLNMSNFKVVICAVHPYAVEARENIISACNETHTPYYIYLRDNSSYSDLPESLEIYHASNHSHAAKIANNFTGNILLTTGSRNLLPYMEIINNSSERIFARVLNCSNSEDALLNAGISSKHSILARGPFSLEDNINTIKQYNISTLITKDGGIKGGTPEKLEAASLTSCRVIIINRPIINEKYFSNINELLNQI